MTSLRVWRVCKETGREFPRLTDDDALDFMIVEALAMKAQVLEQEQQEQMNRKDFRGSHKGLTRADLEKAKAQEAAG